MKLKSIIAILTATFISTSVWGGHHACDYKNKEELTMLSNSYDAWKAVTNAMASCGNFTPTLDKDFQQKHSDALAANPSLYDIVGISNGSITPLINAGTVRPLDDLVKKHGSKLKKNQLITINGKVMAVAFMANAQHLVYRSDILEKAGLSVPKTYEEMLAGAKIIKDKGLMDYPLGGAYKAGWNLAQEFTNMYIGHGGEFFKSGSAEVSVNNAKGIATLEMLKALSAYMNPDFLTHDSNVTSAEWKAGNVAMMNMWGSRMGPLMDPEQSTPTVVKTTTLGDPMTVGGGSTPATTLWWDGWTVAKNISESDAEATFKAMMNGINPKRLDDKMMPLAVWLIEGFKPGPANVGVAAAARMNAIPYPMLPYQGLLHSALGSEIVDFMQGKEDAATALADVEAAYTAAAKEKGFLN